MKLKILGTNGEDKGQTDLPEQFKEQIRQDLIKRAVIAIQANARQAYGAFEEAGKRASAYISKRRRQYRGTYGIGQSRTPRKVLSRSGTRFNYAGAFAPQTRGGRQAHPPKPDKDWSQKVNKTENRKAIRSALAATLNTDLAKARGHKVPATYPFILSTDFEKISKTSDLVKSLDKLGFKDEMNRAKEKKIRAGIGKLRGRKYKKKTSALFVVGNECELEKAARNIPGADAVQIQNINAELLAPGATPGRLTLYTESAIKKMTSEKLFTKNYKAPKQAEEKPAVKKVVKKVVKKTAKKEGEQ